MNLFNQKLILTKDDGTIKTDIAASVQEKVYIQDVTTPVEEGDILTYTLPSGIERKLLVNKMVVHNAGSRLDHIEATYTII